MLESGVVTEAREPRAEVMRELKRLFALRRQVDEAPHTKADDKRDAQESLVPDHPTALPLRVEPFASGSKFHSIDLQALADSDSGKRSWGALQTELENYWALTRMARDQWERTGRKFELWKTPEVRIADITFRSANCFDHGSPGGHDSHRPGMFGPAYTRPAYFWNRLSADCRTRPLRKNVCK